MRRAAFLLSWPAAALSAAGGGGAGFGGSGVPTMTRFAHRAASLKRKYRGKGQYEFARREAEQFLENEVPQHGTNVWIEQGNNAVALAQLLSFFEIEPEGSLQALITNKLLRLLEDTNHDGVTRLLAAIALSHRGEQYLERTFSAVEKVLQEIMQEGSSYKGDGVDAWSLIEYGAKVLQRGGKHSPSTLGEKLAQVAMAYLQRTPTTEMQRLQGPLLRVYSWLVRTGKVTEANHFLVALLDHAGDFHSYDFGTLMSSCLRHHQALPFPIQLQQRLARAGLAYSTTANGRDVASIVGCVAKMVGSLQPGKNGATQHEVCELGGRLNTLLEEYEARVLRFFDREDKLHWNHCDDMTTIAFAYEMGGRLRYRSVFVAYQGYAAQHVNQFEPQQLAMAAGILRRSNLLSQELAHRLSERIETVLGEFSLSEISHICATFAPMSPSWMQEAKAVASRLLQPDCSSHTKLLLALAFPDDDSLHAQVDFSDVSGRQLVDSLSLMHGTKFDDLVVVELITRLQAAQERFSPDDIRLLQATGRPQLQSACVTFLASRFAEPEWSSDTLYCLPLAVGLVPHALDAGKALAAAKTVSVSPEQFVSLVELMTSVFGTESGESIVHFVVSGGMDLLGAERIRIGTVLRYLEAVRRLMPMYPSSEWLSRFSERFSRHIEHMTPKEVESLLCSLCAIYGTIARQPLLQQVLSDVVKGPYDQLVQADEAAARITVLIASIQQGAAQPLLNQSTPMVISVRTNVDSYDPKLREAVMTMSLPQEVEQKRAGRFTLKMTRAIAEAPPETGLSRTQDLNEALSVDPFSEVPILPKIENITNSSTAVGGAPPLVPGGGFIMTPPADVSAVGERKSLLPNTFAVPKETSSDTAEAVNSGERVSDQQQRQHNEPTAFQLSANTAVDNNKKSFGSTLWSMFSNPMDDAEGVQKTQHYGAAASTSSPVTLRSQEGRGNTPYAGYFSHGNPSAGMFSNSSFDEPPLSKVPDKSFDQQVGQMNREGMQPRRTKLQPSDSRHSEMNRGGGNTGTDRFFKQETPKFELNNWGAPPPTNTGWMPPSSPMWKPTEQTSVPTQAGLTGLDSSWPSMKTQSTATFGGRSSGNLFDTNRERQPQNQYFGNQFHNPQQHYSLQDSQFHRQQQFQHQQHQHGHQQIQFHQPLQEHHHQHQALHMQQQQPQGQQFFHQQQPLLLRQQQQHQPHSDQRNQQQHYGQQQQQQQFISPTSPYTSPTIQAPSFTDNTAQQINVLGPRGNYYADQSASTRARPVITKKNILKSTQSSSGGAQNEESGSMHGRELSEASASSQKLRGKGDTIEPKDEDDESTESSEEAPVVEVVQAGKPERKSKRPIIRTDLKEWLSSPPEKELEPMRSKSKKAAAAAAVATPTPKGKAKETAKRGRGREPAATKAAPVAKGKAAAKKTPSAKGAAKGAAATPAKGTATTTAKGATKVAAKGAAAKPKKAPPKPVVKKQVAPATPKKRGRKPADKTKGGKR